MVFTALLILFTVVPAMLWLGLTIWGKRGVKHFGRPHATTDGGEPTVYRRRTPREDAEITRGNQEQGPTPA